MDYSESSKWYLELEKLGSKPGLEVISKLLESLDFPQYKFHSVHVTGTNGKGSTSAMIAAILQASGYHVGLFTSPHLSTWRESIRVDGEMINKENSTTLLNRIKPISEQIELIIRHPTQFEVLTAMAFTYFAMQHVDFAVVEVGMGGRLDATNVLKSEVAVITNVSLEHTNWLGDTVIKIAREKAGIIKPRCSVVTATNDESVYNLILLKAKENNASVVRVGTDVTYFEKYSDFYGQTFQVNGKLGIYELETPLIGEFQVVNTATAIAVIEELVRRGFKVMTEAIITGIKNVHWPGRLEIIQHSPTVIIDGAKDAEAAKSLRRSIEKLPHKKIIAVIAISSDKNIPAMVKEIAAPATLIIATSHRVLHRTADPALIAAEALKQGKNVKIIPNSILAIKKALELAESDDIILITGSVFLAGEAREYWYPVDD